jgi:glycerol-3-phosphate dehydrogenase
MPIAEQVGRVLYDHASVPEAISVLMGRSAKAE